MEKHFVKEIVEIIILYAKSNEFDKFHIFEISRKLFDYGFQSLTKLSEDSPRIKFAFETIKTSLQITTRITENNQSKLERWWTTILNIEK
jgi:hypothetical protein